MCPWNVKTLLLSVWDFCGPFSPSFHESLPVPEVGPVADGKLAPFGYVTNHRPPLLQGSVLAPPFRSPDDCGYTKGTYPFFSRAFERSPGCYILFFGAIFLVTLHGVFARLDTDGPPFCISGTAPVLKADRDVCFGGHHKRPCWAPVGLLRPNSDLMVVASHFSATWRGESSFRFTAPLCHGDRLNFRRPGLSRWMR